MDDLKKYYVVVRESRKDLGKVRGMKQVRLYKSMNDAAENEYNIMSFRGMAAREAARLVENGGSIVPKELVYGNSYIEGSKAAYSKLYMLEVVVKDTKDVSDGHVEEVEPIVVDANALDESDTAFVLKSETVRFNNCTSVLDHEYSITSGSNIELVSILGESNFVLDEEIGDIFGIMIKALNYAAIA